MDGETDRSSLTLHGLHCDLIVMPMALSRFRFEFEIKDIRSTIWLDNTFGHINKCHFHVCNAISSFNSGWLVLIQHIIKRLSALRPMITSMTQIG